MSVLSDLCACICYLLHHIPLGSLRRDNHEEFSAFLGEDLDMYITVRSRSHHSYLPRCGVTTALPSKKSLSNVIVFVRSSYCTHACPTLTLTGHVPAGHLGGRAHAEGGGGCLRRRGEVHLLHRSQLVHQVWTGVWIHRDIGSRRHQVWI